MVKNQNKENLKLKEENAKLHRLNRALLKIIWGKQGDLKEDQKQLVKDYILKEENE